MLEIESKQMSMIRVFVGLSGGVDSSVSAALLKAAGYDVTGVFIKVWQPDWISCNWKEERLEAMRAAAHLGIKFETLDLEDEYKREVIDYMIEEYRRGRTPNPDVMCNRYVKFGAFAEWARSKGADYVATGHYAQIGQSTYESPLKKLVGRIYDFIFRRQQISRLKIEKFSKGQSVKSHPPLLKLQRTRMSEQLALFAGTDTNKDQSYFLWTLKQKDLEHILFPVGHLTKPEVRKLARKFKLPNAEKKDSQGLCFIGKVDVKEFLSHYIKLESGNVCNERGEIIGTHPGALLFTIGERHGFIVTEKTPNDAPYYVIDKDIEHNTITVSNRNASDLLPGGQKSVRISGMNWISGQAPEIEADGKGRYAARGRYRQPLQEIVHIKAGITETEVEFRKPQDTLTPGQSLVIYRGDECIGGGIIEG